MLNADCLRRSMNMKYAFKRANGIVTAEQQPEPQQQNNNNCSWVETK